MNIKNLTLKEKIGQMLCFAHRGTTYNAELKTLIEDYHLGSVIHFAHNIESISQLRELNASIQAKAKYPVFISVDQEGGMVRRVVDGITYLPGAMSLSASFEDIYDISKYCAMDLKELGIHINYAPVADINTNPQNPVINSRSFGDDPSLVATQVVRAAKAFMDAGILPTAKHFPGHGDTNVDSHLGLPIVNKTKEELYKEELFPYVQAIEAGIDGIMISHILFPELDKDYPATLSHKIITKLLREELSFDGLITTDSLTMKAIWGQYPIREIVKRGVLAGNDILVFCGGAELETQIEIFNSFYDLVEKGEIPLDIIDNAVARIIALKEKYCTKPLGNNLNQGEKLAYQLVKKSITKVYDKGLLPLLEQDKVLIIFPKIHLASLVDNENATYETFSTYLKYDEFIIDRNKENFKEIVTIKKNYDKIILATLNVTDGDYFTELFAQLDKDKIIHIALRSPYDANILKGSAAFIATYDCTKESLRAVSSNLVSNKFGGILPIKLEVQK